MIAPGSARMRLDNALGSREWRHASERAILCNHLLPDCYGERDKGATWRRAIRRPTLTRPSSPR
jgi:hypothetical protein